MDSDDAHAQLEQARQLIHNALANGVEALAQLKDTLTGLKFASEQLELSRVEANKQLEEMAALNDQLELILEGSLNVDIIAAQGELKLAIRHVNDFRDRTQYHLNNINKISAILNVQVQPSIEEPSNILKRVREVIEQWARYL